MIATRMTNNQFHIISVFYQEMSKSMVCPWNELLDFDWNRFAGYIYYIESIDQKISSHKFNTAYISIYWFILPLFVSHANDM